MRVRSLVATLVFGLISAVAVDAAADIQHVVGKGHTLQAIANRYHVTVKAIMDANHLTDGKHLRPGDILTIPKLDARDGKKAGDLDKSKDHLGTSATKDSKDARDGKGKKGGKDDPKGDHNGTFQLKAKTPGIIHIKRLATQEEADLHAGGKISASTSKSIEKLLRSPSGASHPIEPRLISLLATVSNHFGSRKIEVISGFRPYTPTQYTAHSNHNHGKAVDFRVVGVPNEVVRDYCRTLKNTGCGYYPNSTFVHMDARDASAFWIDYSKAGEPPRYNAPNVDADEGTSDVHEDSHPAANTAPPVTKDEPAPGTANEPSTMEEKSDEPSKD